jgi:hypothetical protein
MAKSIVGEGSTPDYPELDIPFEKVCGVISMARQFDAKEGVTEPDPDSNPADDGESAILQDHADDPVQQELVTFLRDLNIDEQTDLVTLMRLGRGDGELADWRALRSETASGFESRDALALVTIPLLSDYLEEAMSQFGESCEGLDADRL